MNFFQVAMKAPKPKRSTFNLSHEVKLTTDFAKCTPILCEEVVPGDTWQLQSNILVRFAPLIAPVMHDISVYTHFFYVPYRLLWDKFEDFETGGETGEFIDPVNDKPLWPRLMMKVHGADPNGKFAVGSLADYLNYPTSDSNVVGHINVSAMPFRAYQMIWNEYYRDENLQEKLDIKTGSGTITEDSDEYNMLLTLRNRNWAKDYFTSALPNPQKGPAQNVPVFGTGQVATTQKLGVQYFNDQISPATIIHNPGSSESEAFNAVISEVHTSTGDSRYDVGNISSPGKTVGTPIAIYQNGQYVDPNGLPVQLNGLEFSINDLRRASAIQRWLERNARGGTRYIEMLLAHFGIISDDLRLQRPQYLGGGRTPVTVSDVLQTSQTTESSPQGQYAGIGFSFGKKNIFKNTFKERGVIIGIMTIMPKPAYAEGLPRAYHKFSRFDHYYPEFAHLGEQEVYNYELALRQDIYETFGYAPRYSEYKYIPSRVHGEFKTTLGFWNLNRHYQSQPNLTEEFIECNPDTNDLNRIFAVEDATENHLFVQIKHDIKARRPMPYLPEPSL